MSTPTRWVMVDDTDSKIQYSGAWFQARGTLDNLGNFGAPFLSTSHGINANGSLSYTFSGSRVIVYGTSKVEPGGANGHDPSWACSVDGVSIPAKDAIDFSENNWILCEADSLSDGQHTVKVQGTVLDPTNTFWFDRFNYVPSSSVSLDNVALFVDSSDPAIQYGSGWGPLRDIGEMTQQNGAKATFDFTGVQLSWFSLIPGGDVPGAQASATYSIDGGTPVSFLLAGLTAGAMEPYNQIFFQTPQLSAGKHHLEVIHGGNGQTTPLSLDYLVIQNAPVQAGSSGTTGASGTSAGSFSSSTSAGSTTSAGSSTAPSGTPAGGSNTGLGSHSPTTKSKVPIGAIVGGVVGGIIVIVALVFLFIFLRRRVRKREDVVDYRPVDLAASPSTVEPFHTFPSAPALYQQPSSSSSRPSVPSYPIQTTGKVAQTTTTAQRYAQSPSSGAQSPPLNSSFASNQPPSSGHQSTPSTSTTQLLPMNNKAREARGLDGVAVTSGSTEGETSLQNGSSPGRVVRHEDSGLRLPAREEEPVLELPPLYTPG
ncbi:hypothetical protein GALMADRAFT_256714 [Galerina marginata CBS 339.88]|uniref:Transmembrane protein n=1 Tax=Galerina marginata (strain CBS 339.88) TaxID=685588 RepID=A0A067SCA1_GALM3|nr:hypothetical protein GALMADRAFT_256714 [Galerina marginata CBS 339.88]